MKEQIRKYIAKKKREAALKVLKDNIFVILGALGILILLIVLKILKKKAKKKVNAKIRTSVKNKVESIRNRDQSANEEETEEVE